MPSSPLSRRSPARELKVESACAQRRGHGLGTGYPLKAKDDDLLLFNEVQNRERDNSLLHSDDFDESISKLRYFSNTNLGIMIPTRTESNDIFNADGGKNDYDWLLTPPETPLFASLDDDVSQPVNVPRGRTRTQYISNSKTAISEKTPRLKRSIESPHRLSSSPRSSYSVSHSRSRPTSVTHSSPPPVRQPATHSRSPSTPPTRPSLPARRSLTPTSRRMSTGSSTDLPATRLRGLSPISGHRRRSTSNCGRHSVSPTSSKTVTSSNNRGEQLSSISKQSAASSNEDDSESHAFIGVPYNAAATKDKDFAHTRAMGFSKKPSRSPSSSSAPKRSFDLVIRQMDHHKTPQNMFRPLLSSVPVTTFHSGKPSSVHRPIFSRNSSRTTSSNSSSELGTSVVLYMQDSDNNQSDQAGDLDRKKVTGLQEDIFVFDKLCELNEDTCHNTSVPKCGNSIEIIDMSLSNEVESKLDNLTISGVLVDPVASQGSSFAVDVSGNHASEKMIRCSSCGKYFNVLVVDKNVCQECSVPNCLVNSKEPRNNVPTHEIDSVENLSICLNCGKSFIVKDMILGRCQECDAIYGLNVLKGSGTKQVTTQDDPEGKLGYGMQRETTLSILHDSRDHFMPNQHGQLSEKVEADFSTGCEPCLRTDEDVDNLSKHEILNLNELDDPESCSKCESPPSQSTSCRSDNAGNSEGTGIVALLMNTTSSRKWPLMRGKSISATNILFPEPCYGGADMNALKHSLGRDSSSASSSIDLGPSGQTYRHLLHQLSYRRNDIDNARCECLISDSEKFTVIGKAIYPQIQMEQVSSLISFALEDEVENEVSSAEKPDNLGGKPYLSTTKHISTKQAAIGTYVSSHSTSSLAMGSILMQLGEENNQHDTSIASNPRRSSISCGNTNEVWSYNRERSNEEVERLANQGASSTEDSYTLTNMVCGTQEISDTAATSSSLIILDQQSEMVSCQNAQVDGTSAAVTSHMEGFQKDCISKPVEKDLLFSELGSNFAQDPTMAEPMATAESPKKQMQRSFTLEEATDTVLFCSSIVHDTAYKAATIALDKEFPANKFSLQPVAFLASSVPRIKDFREASIRYTKSPRKLKHRKPETADKLSSVEITEITPCNKKDSDAYDNAKPPKLESKCNCTVM
ncbi:probable serine/threonine-protein kinase nek3 isoform X2 [Zingiber officinale]|uniref:probable serine/threonine-protein kinase nek3 isoform X2 n=1 Tax=Zingiber officinale TaxID=94328 RepID=UPI001C4A8A9A|nr:probable serine/threonine-protein kinase nek3 isoform X2 [Zingiber officinale]